MLFSRLPFPPTIIPVRYKPISDFERVESKLLVAQVRQLDLRSSTPLTSCQPTVNNIAVMRLSLVSLALSATASALQGAIIHSLSHLTVYSRFSSRHPVSFSTPSTSKSSPSHTVSSTPSLTTPLPGPAGLIFETFSWWNKPPIPKFNTHFFEDAIKLGWQKAHDGAVEQFELAKRLAEENKINFNITPLVEKAKMLIDATRELREQIFLLHPDEEVAAMLDGVDLDGFSEEFGKLLEDVQRSLEAQFPHPDGAPSHEERSGRVRAALSQAKESFVRLSVAHGIEEEKARESFGKIEPLVHDLVVLAGRYSDADIADSNISWVYCLN